MCIYDELILFLSYFIFVFWRCENRVCGKRVLAQPDYVQNDGNHIVLWTLHDTPIVFGLFYSWDITPFNDMECETCANWRRFYNWGSKRVINMHIKKEFNPIDASAADDFWKHHGERRNCLKRTSSPFATMFLTF